MLQITLMQLNTQLHGYIIILQCLPKVRPSNGGGYNSKCTDQRRNEGCILQLLYVALLIELANSKGKDLFLLLVYYEIAFDYANCALIIEEINLQSLLPCMKTAITF